MLENKLEKEKAVAFSLINSPSQVELISITHTISIMEETTNLDIGHRQDVLSEGIGLGVLRPD